jgi:hypothetical protein
VEKTKDIEIRKALLDSTYVHNLKNEDNKTLLVEEFSLLDTRIDLAIFNGHFHGFEIKSDKDTLLRLSRQIEGYEKVFEYLHLVVGEKHLEHALTRIPFYWGVFLAEKKMGSVVLHEIRPSSANSNQDPYEIARMLWKSETISLLEKYGLLAGFKSKPCRILWKRLSSELPLPKLEEEVRQILKARGDWRAAAKQKRYDAKCQPFSMSFDYQSENLLL